MSSQRECPNSIGACLRMAIGPTAAQKTRAIYTGAKSRDVSHGRPVQSRGWLPLPTCQNKGFPRVLSPLTRRQSWLTSGYQTGFRQAWCASSATTRDPLYHWNSWIILRRLVTRRDQSSINHGFTAWVGWLRTTLRIARVPNRSSAQRSIRKAKASGTQSHRYCLRGNDVSVGAALSRLCRL
jgi:hypothetical protein